jgi:hypothetical protein
VTTMPRTMGLILTALLLVAAVVLLSRGPAPDQVRPGPDGVLELTMEDYRFDTPEMVLPAGEPIMLRFINRDEVSHHISFGREIVEENNRAVGFQEDLLAGVDLRVTPPGAEIDLAPPYQGTTVQAHGGETVTLEMTLPEERRGTWELGCFTGRGCHYRAGLAAEVIVE